ncbi:MAG: HAD family hydrolase [Lachnospiraceae bacterium]|nr:HAD family hydrolase [Lachnospiraceae bacterium]
MKIKLIVFDLDGTLYDLEDVSLMNYMIQIDYIKMKTNMRDKEITQLFKNNGIYSQRNEKSKSCTELFAKMGFDLEEWSEFRENNFLVKKINKIQGVDDELMSQFGKVGTLILLSSNSNKNINDILKHLEINSNYFNEIICSDKNCCIGTFSKYKVMLDLLKRYNVNSQEIISIGDRFLTDIEPVLKINGIGLLINKPISLRKILLDLENDKLSTCEGYKLFKSVF